MKNMIMAGIAVLAYGALGEVQTELKPGDVTLRGYVGERLDGCIRNNLLATDVSYLTDWFRWRTERNWWHAEFWGKFMHGAVPLAEYSRNAALKAKVDAGVKAILAAQLPDGYIGNYAADLRDGAWSIWDGKYTLLGLLLYHEATGDGASLNAAKKLADYLYNHFGRGMSKEPLHRIGNYRGLPSCSLLEPIIWLYRSTKEPRYRDFADYIVDFDKWLDGKLDHLERDVLPWARKYGIQICIDLPVPPGGRDETKDLAMYYDKTYAAHFVTCWRRIATRFKGQSNIYGYDLINEPVQTRRATVADYWTLQRLAAEEIRKIDPSTPIIIEAVQWDSADAFAYLSPLRLDNVIYQVHMYQPGEYTHQGVHAKTAEYGHYPWPNPEKKWDKDYIRSRLAPVRAFEKKYNAKIYVGEFSAINWAEGADRYIADCIDVFNEYNWDWTFHAFREWPGWSVEHVGTNARDLHPSSDNPRKRALLEGLRKGIK